MAVYTDRFNRPDSSSLGTIPDSTLTWRVISGTWSILSNHAHTTTSVSNNPIAVVDTPNVNADISLDVGAGDAIYFRVVDASNWLRLRARRWTHTSSSTYYTTEYQWARSYFHVGHLPSDGITYTLTVWSDSNTTAPDFPDTIVRSHTHADGTTHSHNFSDQGARYLTGATRQVAHSGSYSTTYYQEILEQCVNGTISTLASSNARTSPAPGRIRVLATGSTIVAYRGPVGATPTTQMFSTTSTAHLSAVSHGVGRGNSESSTEVLDNFTIDTLNTAPYAPTLVSPANGAVLNRQQNQTFSWQFNDPDPGDSQSGYVWAYQPAGTGMWSTTGASDEPHSQHIVIAPAFAPGDYEWRVKTLDAQGLESPWSETRLFTAADAPPPSSFVDPVDGGIIPTKDYLISWSASNQDGYQLQILDGETVLVDTGQVNDALARFYLAQFPDNNVTRTIRVRVLYAGLWSPWSTATVTVSYTPPPVPWLTATPVDVGAGVPSAIRVDVEDPRLRVDARNLLTNPSGEATSGTVEVRRNLVTNPSLEADTNKWSAWYGATGSRLTTDGYRGSAHYRVSADGSTVGQGLSAEIDVNLDAQQYVGRIALRMPSGARPVNVWCRIVYTDNTLNEGTLTQITPGASWSEYVTQPVTADAGKTQARVYLFARVSQSGGGAFTLDGDAALIEKGTIAGSYFDGSYSPDPDLTPEWTGTANASESRLVGPAPVGWTGAYYSTSRDRIAALPSGATYTLAADPGPATLVVETETDTVRTPHTGTAVTVTEPYFRAAVVASNYTGPYFDGDTPSDGEFSYRWTGTPDASTSERVHYGTSGELAESTEPLVVAHDVWVRGGPEGEIRLAADLPASLPYLWHLPASGVDYEFRARAIGDNGTSSWSDWTP